MAVAELVGKKRMIYVDRIIALLNAMRNRNDAAAQRVAQSIVSDELLANHHEEARDLQRAMSWIGAKKSPSSTHHLQSLPKDKRFGENLVTLDSPKNYSGPLIVDENLQLSLDRVLQEFAHRRKLASYGYRPKTKLLFWGPPGCGKTRAAHSLALSLGLPIAIIRLSTLVTSYMGETASHIQRVVDAAQASPMVLLFDEADAIGKERDDPNDVGELKRVVNGLLQSLDSFSTTESIIVFASNHQYQLDEALWRRFDDVLHFSFPSTDQIKTLLRVLLNGVQTSGSIDPIAKSASALSFAQIENVVIDCIKSMILQDESSISTALISESFQIYKAKIKAARKPTAKGP